MTTEPVRAFSAPQWLRDLGFASWLLVGFVLVLVALVWLLDQTSTIVMPVILAGVLGAVSGPLVDWLGRHRIPRAGGAVIVLLLLVLIAVLVFCLVVGGVTNNSGDISARATQALAKVEGWLHDLGVSNTSSSSDAIKADLPKIRETLTSGIVNGISGLTSLVFFISFSALGTFFVLKDGPVMGRFINRHMGVPVPIGQVVTSSVATGLRQYFGGVTIIAAFNGVVVGLGALILGVPLAGTIAIVTFLTAFVPFVGAWVAGAFAVVLALGSQGTTAAIVLAVIVLLANGLLQNILQPFVFGATLSLNPLVVLIVTIGAGSLFGMVGLTLAAPLTSAAVHISNALREGAGEPDGPLPESAAPA